MQNLKRTNLLSLVGFVAIVLSGCGGESTDVARLPSIYAGTWAGNWTSVTANEQGAISFAVSADGSVTGSMARKDGTAGNLGGIVQTNGTLLATAAFSGGGNYVIGGPIIKSNGKLQSNFSYSYFGNQFTGSFDVSPGGGAGGN